MSIFSHVNCHSSDTYTLSPSLPLSLSPSLPLSLSPSLPLSLSPSLPLSLPLSLFFTCCPLASAMLAQFTLLLWTPPLSLSLSISISLPLFYAHPTNHNMMDRSLNFSYSNSLKHEVYSAHGSTTGIWALHIPLTSCNYHTLISLLQSSTYSTLTSTRVIIVVHNLMTW